MRIDQPYGSRFDQGLEPLEPTHKYFIACEGKRTEYQYFKGLIKARIELGTNPLVEVIPIRHESRTGGHPLRIDLVSVHLKEQLSKIHQTLNWGYLKVFW